MAGKILVYKEYNKIEELTLQEDHEVHCAESWCNTVVGISVENIKENFVQVLYAKNNSPQVVLWDYYNRFWASG